MPLDAERAPTNRLRAPSKFDAAQLVHEDRDRLSRRVLPMLSSVDIGVALGVPAGVGEVVVRVRVDEGEVTLAEGPTSPPESCPIASPAPTLASSASMTIISRVRRMAPAVLQRF